MSEIEIVVAEFMKGYKEDRIQMFDSPSILPDSYEVLYYGKDGLVRYCKEYDYMEIIGADQDEYEKIKNQYGY